MGTSNQKSGDLAELEERYFLSEMSSSKEWDVSINYTQVIKRSNNYALHFNVESDAFPLEHLYINLSSFQDLCLENQVIPPANFIELLNESLITLNWSNELNSSVTNVQMSVEWFETEISIRLEQDELSDIAPLCEETIRPKLKNSLQILREIVAFGGFTKCRISDGIQIDSVHDKAILPVTIPTIDTSPEIKIRIPDETGHSKCTGTFEKIVEESGGIKQLPGTEFAIIPARFSDLTPLCRIQRPYNKFGLVQIHTAFEHYW